ncbi:hypothetical protein DPEC_G00073230 [Dallia pectoralis]|uniref:Uncharacterized protein n=1 Tax=Dallia pectoralis TaxID=75939 RepID=A0ACC2H355_DALPE|nr:hypothetical protein DPEC_G00073230 [Dallia pectoralis]
MPELDVPLDGPQYTFTPGCAYSDACTSSGIWVWARETGKQREFLELCKATGGNHGATEPGAGYTFSSHLTSLHFLSLISASALNADDAAAQPL